MNAKQLLTHFDRLAEAPDAVPRLRRFILDLAVRGKLVVQDAGDEPAAILINQIAAEKGRLVRAGLAGKQEAFEPKLDTDTPFPIPNAWIWVPATFPAYMVSDLGKKMQTKDVLQSGEFPVVDQGKVFIRGYCNDQDKVIRVAAPLILFGDHTRETKLIDFDFVVGADGVKLLQPVCLFTRYYFLSLQWLPLDSRGYGRHFKLLKSAYIPLPPLAEQHRIVAKVDELMALCDQLEAAQHERERCRDRLAAASLQRLNQPAADATPEVQREHARFHLNHLPRFITRPEQVRAMRQMVLNFAVHGWLVPQMPVDGCAQDVINAALVSRKESWNSEQAAKAKINEKVLAKDWQTKYVNPIHEDGLFDLPHGWAWASTLEVCECVENGNTPSPHEMTDGAGEIPFLKVYNLTKTGELDFTVKPTFISRQVHEGKLQRSRILTGDVLMNIVGPPLGKVSLVTDQYPEWNTNQAVVLFRPSNALLSKYLTLCLLSDAVLTWITRQAQATVGQSNISVSKSRALPIPLPPLAEQHRIVAKVDELMALCDQLEAQLATTQTDSRRLLEAVLEAALV